MTGLVSAGLLATAVVAGTDQALALQGVALVNVGTLGPSEERYALDNDGFGGQDSSVLANQRNGAPNQVWKLEPQGGDPVQLKQDAGGSTTLCAAAVSNGVSDVTMQPCHTGSVTYWREVQAGEGAFVYRSAVTNECIAATRINAPVELVACDWGNEALQWEKDPTT